MTAKHTTGPWRFEDDRVRSDRETTDGNAVANPFWNVAMPINEAIANAHLIAAAPELLEALETIIEYGACEENIQQARAAIAKAEGK